MNWIFYRECLVFTAKAAGLGDHLDKVYKAPDPLVPADPQNPTTEETASIARHPGVVKLWKSEEVIVKQGITLMILDSLFLKVKGEATAGKMWEKVKDEFKMKFKMMTVDLHWKLQEEHCPENGDVKAHLTKLQSLCEDLTAMGADPGDENFVAILLGSLPPLYDLYLAALTATSALLNKTHDPGTYLHGIGDEADRCTLKSQTKEAKEVAFNADSSSSKGGRKGKGKKSNVECYNCHKKGHISVDCWAKGGGKEGQGPKQKGKGRAAANTAADSVDNGVWAAAYEYDSEEESEWLERAEQNVAEQLAAEYSRGQENNRLEGPEVEFVEEEIAWLTDDGDISLDEMESSKLDAEMDNSLPNCSSHEINTESNCGSMPD